MNKQLKPKPLACMFLLSLSLLTGGSAIAQQQEVNIRFDAEINGKAFSCGQTYNNIGTKKSSVTPSDFRMYISEVHLIDEKGNPVEVNLTQDQTWQLDNVALLDFENGTGPCRNGTPPLNQTIRGNIAPGKYTGLQFTMGVPFARNHGDPTVAPAPLSSTAMFWNWQGGYKFLKFDMASHDQNDPKNPTKSSAGVNASGFSVHLGSTLCASAGKTVAPGIECKNPNRVKVTFNQFDPKKNMVIADIGTVLSQSNVDINTPNTPSGCMSFLGDVDCESIMPMFGLPYADRTASTQQFFKVR